MGYTNKTTHYELPQYVATDKPKYLTDFNETMVAIDTQMYANAQAASAADGKADAAQSTADGAVSSIGTLNIQINGDPEDPTDTGLNGEVADNSSDIDTIQSLLGDGHPTTSNQTVIGAINGLEGTIAPREDGDDLANNYSEGAQFARGGSVYKALVPLTAGTAFASLTLNTDYTAADTLVEQIADVKGDIPTVPEHVLSFVETKSFIANADGVKTWAELQAEAMALYASYVNDLTDKHHRILSASAMGYMGALEGEGGIRSTAPGQIRVAYMGSGSSMSILWAEYQASSANCKCRQSTVDGNGFTGTDISSTAPASGNNAAIVAEFYTVS